MDAEKTIVWFRQDLRLKDNAAIAHAKGATIAVYIWAPQEEGGWAYGEASRCWLHAALLDLDEQLRVCGGNLLVIDASSSSSLEALEHCVREFQATRVVWNRRYEPSAVLRDTRIKRSLSSQGLEVESFNSRLLQEPSDIANQSGKPFQVFTPFWKACVQREVDGIATEVPGQMKWAAIHSKIGVGALQLLPSLPWGVEMMKHWEPTRQGALKRLKKMLEGGVQQYGDLRDRPDLDQTSQLSPYLHFGQIGPREVYHHLASLGDSVHSGYLRQLYWRDFAHHLLFHFPETATQPLKPKYALFPWQDDEEIKQKWREGKTGYPIVDAGLRQLWQTGWMHNRVRMIVGSVLVKHGLQDWMVGAQWFWDTLVDADLANNTLGWQWVAGCGADASPYFRVFNPIIQGKKFDPNGDYVRHYVPEIAELPTEYIHCPWDASEIELLATDVKLGETYPEPMVEHTKGRERALSAYQKFKENSE